MIEDDNTETYRKTVPASRIIDCGDHKLIMHCIVGKYYPWITLLGGENMETELFGNAEYVLFF